MSLESNSNLGGLGALLIILTSIFSFFGLIGTLLPSLALAFSPIAFFLVPVGLVGLILFFVSMNGLARVYKQQAIFNNVLYALLSIIAGFIVLFALTFALIFFELSRILPTLNPGTLTPSSYPELTQSIAGYLIPVFAGGAAVGLVSMLFLRRAFNSLADTSGVPRFKTAGLLFPVSAIVATVFLLLAACLTATGLIPLRWIWVISLPGSAVQLAAWVLAMQSFFSLKLKARANQALPLSQQPSAQPMGAQVKYCPHCGAQNKTEAVYCASCSKQM